MLVAKRSNKSPEWPAPLLKFGWWYRLRENVTPASTRLCDSPLGAPRPALLFRGWSRCRGNGPLAGGMGGRRGVTSPRRHPSVQHGTWCSDAAWKSLCPQPKLREAERWGCAPAPFLLALPLQPPWARRGNLLGCSLCPTSSQLLQDVGYEHTRAYRWVYPPQQLPGENRVANASSPAFPPSYGFQR